MRALALMYSGYVLWSAGSVKVSNGGTQVLATDGIEGGVTYVFTATGTCGKPKAPGHAPRHGAKHGRKKSTPLPNAFGTSFKVYIGSLDPMPLDTALGEHARNALTFRAAEDNPQIRVEDHTDSKINVKCSITDLAIRVP